MSRTRSAATRSRFLAVLGIIIFVTSASAFQTDDVHITFDFESAKATLGAFSQSAISDQELTRIARLPGVRHKADYAVRVAGGKSLRCRDIGSRFHLIRMLVVKDLLVACLVVVENEIELVFEERRPRIRPRTPQDNEIVIHFEIRKSTIAVDPGRPGAESQALGDKASELSERWSNQRHSGTAASATHTGTARAPARCASAVLGAITRSRLHMIALVSINGPAASST